LLHIFTWWLILQVLGWAALPLAYRLLKWLPGRGYTFAKPLGLLLVSYTFWILTSFGFLRNTWAAIEWLQANAPGVPVILEAPGRSYNYEGRISAFTGFPAVLGWSLHEGQWRGNYTEQGKREPDIATIYTTHDGQQALGLLHRWKVDYVIVGATERRYVEQLCSAPDRHCRPAEALKKFDALLKPVFKQGRTTIYQVR
jgi:uncharacterized membrane protein